MKIKILIFLLMLMPCIAFAAASLNDNAMLLNQTQAQQLNKKIQQVEQKYGIKIGIVTQRSIKNQDVNQYSQALLDNYDFNVLLLIAMDTRQWSIATDNSTKKILGHSSTLDNAVVSRLSNNDYAGAFNNYVDVIDQLLDYYVQNGNSQDSGGFNPIAAMAAFAGAIFIGVMYRSSLIASMSNVRPAIEASEYLNKSSVKLIENRDTFLYMNVKRQPKQRGSSGAHSGGGGGHGGGSSHGGGF